MNKNESIDIEFSLEDNLEAVLKLNQTVHDMHFQNHQDVFNPYNAEKFKPWFQNFLKREDTISILVKMKGKYIGYALLVHRKSTIDNPFATSTFESLYVDQMSIQEEYQNKGIGGKLIAYIKSIARERGIHKIQLDVWKENSMAKEFYTKNEFNTIREIMELQIE